MTRLSFESDTIFNEHDGDDEMSIDLSLSDPILLLFCVLLLQLVASLCLFLFILSCSVLTLNDN